MKELLKKLPSVSSFIDSKNGKALSATYGEGLVKLLLRDWIAQLRGDIQSGKTVDVPEQEDFSADLEEQLKRFACIDGRRAINATGIMVHTALGRAPLPKRAREAVSIEGYQILQVDPETNTRSVREAKIERLLAELTGSEAATVVCNNAAATFLALNTICPGKEVIISRGQLIEIGGSFRLPDVMKQSGVVLKEVGTTNRTHLKDYEKAISENTGAILFVDPSNYSIEGFSSTPDVKELCALGAEKNIPVIADLGSGALIDMSRWGISSGGTIKQSLENGAAVTCSSGDKLIGGPQMGILCGKAEVIKKLRKNPFMRMFRVDKMCLAALEETLIEYVNGTYLKEIPLYQMLEFSIEELKERASKLLSHLSLPDQVECEIGAGTSYIGGGAVPEQAIDSVVLKISLKNQKKRNSFAEQCSSDLRNSIPSVFCRIADEALFFDMRSVFDRELKELAESINQAVQSKL